MKKCDVVVLGSGPAGLQSSIYVARRKLKVVNLGRLENSALNGAHLENYLGFYPQTSSIEFLKNSKAQAEHFGAEFFDEDAVSVMKNKDGLFEITTENKNILVCKSVIVATGVHRNKLGVKGEETYVGKGVSYCVECDAFFFKDKTVAVVGDGSAATSGADFLMKFAKEVVRVSLKNSGIKEILGDGNKVTGFLDVNGNLKNVDGVFIELGSKSVLELFMHLGIEFDENVKFIKIDANQATNIPGVFAAGDICGTPWQVAKAVGQGCIAGISAGEYVKKL